MRFLLERSVGKKINFTDLSISMVTVNCPYVIAYRQWICAYRPCFIHLLCLVMRWSTGKIFWSINGRTFIVFSLAYDRNLSVRITKGYDWYAYLIRPWTLACVSFRLTRVEQKLNLNEQKWESLTDWWVEEDRGGKTFQLERHHRLSLEKVLSWKTVFGRVRLIFGYLSFDSHECPDGYKLCWESKWEVKESDCR